MIAKTKRGLVRDQLRTFFYWTFRGRNGRRGIRIAVAYCKLRYDLWRGAKL